MQAIVIPVSSDCLEFAESVRRELADDGVRAESDDSASTVGYKIRNAELQKIPYMAIVGKREAKQKKIAVRRHGAGNVGPMTVEELVALVGSDQ